jgi:hypothetical protein
VADIDAALVENVFHISKRKREPDIYQHAKLDDFGRDFEVANRVLAHLQRLNAPPCRLKAVCADNAFGPLVPTRTCPAQTPIALNRQRKA